MNEQEIDNMNPTTLIQAMNTLPIFVNNNTPNSNAGFFARSGTGNLNLRGLGTNRTLTLLNGRRLAPTTAFGGADINLIPAAMLKGVENVTGGASAAYGTDAVAGVTNFLLDTEFTGLEVELQGGITRGGGSGRLRDERFRVAVPASCGSGAGAQRQRAGIGRAAEERIDLVELPDPQRLDGRVRRGQCATGRLRGRLDRRDEQQRTEHQHGPRGEERRGRESPSGR